MLAKRNVKGCCVSFTLCIARCVHKLSPGLFRHVKARGNATVIWTVNEDEDFHELKEEFGDSLDGIMTDRPSRLANWARSYSQPDTRAMNSSNKDL